MVRASLAPSMSNAATVASPGEGFGGASQREKSGGSQDDGIEGKSVTKDEQAEIDKLKQEMEEYKARLGAYEAKLEEFEEELKKYKEAGRIEEARRERIIQQNKALIEEKQTRKRKRAVVGADDTLASKFLRQLQDSEMDDCLIHFVCHEFVWGTR